MSISPNVKYYETIWTLLQKDPTATIAALCKKYKVSYQSYNNWVKRYKKPIAVPTVRPVPSKGVPTTIAVRIPLSEVMDAIKKNKPSISIPRDRLLNAVPPAEQEKIYALIGRAHIHGAASLTDQSSGLGDGEGLDTDDGYEAKGK